jgi:hypothetical protein
LQRADESKDESPTFPFDREFEGLEEVVRLPNLEGAYDLFEGDGCNADVREGDGVESAS